VPSVVTLSLQSIFSAERSADSCCHVASLDSSPDFIFEAPFVGKFSSANETQMSDQGREMSEEEEEEMQRMMEEQEEEDEKK